MVSRVSNVGRKRRGRHETNGKDLELERITLVQVPLNWQPLDTWYTQNARDRGHHFC